MGRKMVLFSIVLTAVFLHPSATHAQEKVDAPVWNIGDKWIFSNKGAIEVVSADQNSYVLRFSEDMCIVESQKFNAIVFDKSTFRRIYGLKGDKRKKYTNQLRKIFDFPLSPGKQWKDDEIYQTPLVSAFSMVGDVPYYQIFKVLGWEDVEVQAGKFRAIKLEVSTGHPPDQLLSRSLYWYSPEAKYFVKCQYSAAGEAAFEEIVSWELSSFKVKK